VGNTASTNQGQSQQQTVGGNGSCLAGCGGAGAFQAGVQNAETTQLALGFAGSEQNAVNANAPAATAGGNVNSGPSEASQTPSSTAGTTASNNAGTNQGQEQSQELSPQQVSGPTAGSNAKAPAATRTVTTAVSRTATTTRRTSHVAGVRTTKIRHAGLAGVRTSAALPFTGVSLLGAFALSVFLMLVGIALRRLSRPRREPGLLGGTALS
jgi:hypothetical protein